MHAFIEFVEFARRRGWHVHVQLIQKERMNVCCDVKYRFFEPNETP